MNKALKSSIKLVLHLQDAAFIAENPATAYIASTRQGLRALAPTAPSIAPLCREAADFIQSILDAKHSCPSVRFAGYGGEFGDRFQKEFAKVCPAANAPLAARLRQAAESIRVTNGLVGKTLTNHFGQGVRVDGAPI